MRKGQRASSSSESGSEEKHRFRTDDCKDESSKRGSSSDEDSSSDSESTIKRSLGFSRSFSSSEDLQQRFNDEHREESGKDGARVAELLDSRSAAPRTRPKKHHPFGETTQPSRSGVFRPQTLWLAMTKCLSLRWPPCLSINSARKLAYQVGAGQLEDTESSISSISTNDSAPSTSSSEDKNVVKNEEEEVRSREVGGAPPPRRGVSRSSPMLPRDRQPSDVALASMILEKDMFLEIELVDRGEDRADLRYRAEWKLSEKTRELAGGVWLSRHRTPTD